MAKRKTTRTGKSAGPTLRDRFGTLAASEAGGWTVLLLAVIVLAAAAPALRRVVAVDAPPPTEVRFTSTPTWVGDSLLRHVAEIAARQFRPAGGRDELVEVHDALARSGWFDAVRHIRRCGDGAIEVDATFLSPVAMVVDDYGEVVVDARGRTLPEGTTLADETHIIQLINPRHNRPSRPAAAWAGDDVAAGLQLHALLTERDWAHQVSSIDLQSFDRTGGLVIVTSLPASITWGSPPGEETPLEALADRKLVRLEEAFRGHGRIDLHLPGPLDLTRASHFVHR